jgi:hypothetical protein
LSGGSESGSDGSHRHYHCYACHRQRSEEAAQGKEAAKDMAPDECKESEKCSSKREAAKNRVLVARLDEDWRQETKHYLAAQALANNEELASKADV